MCLVWTRTEREGERERERTERWTVIHKSRHCNGEKREQRKRCNSSETGEKDRRRWRGRKVRKNEKEIRKRE